MLGQMLASGQHLRSIRESLGFRLKDVQDACDRIAELMNNPEFTMPTSTLSDIETKGIVPSLYRAVALSMVYRQSMEDMLRLFGIDLDQLSKIDSPRPYKTSLVSKVPMRETTAVPLVDPGFDIRHTAEISRFIQRWGTLPVAMLEKFRDSEFLYGYIGLDDHMMYPLLLPGTFVQIDAEHTAIPPGPWSSEHERPIFFLETREGNLCAWCSQSGPGMLTVQGHPLSNVSPRQLRMDRDVNVIGTVVGLAMRLDAAPNPPWRAKS